MEAGERAVKSQKFMLSPNILYAFTVAYRFTRRKAGASMPGFAICET